MITAIALVAAYLIGSIPSGLWIGRVFFHKNLHDYGSGNTGTTNTFRTLGVPAGTVVFAIDLLKGTLAVLLPGLLNVHGISPLIFGLLAVLGHTVSIFDNFKGGKAVATSAGVILGYSPVFFLYLLVIFVIILLLFSMISLSSVSAAVAAILGVLIFPLFHFILTAYDPIFTGIIVILALIILTRHRSNLSRIRLREENVVPFGLNLTHQKKSREK